MEYLLTGAEMSACDARTSDPGVIGIPSLVLMERAALSVADGADDYLRTLPDSAGRTVLAVAGRGNNGADALAAGRILLERGYEVRFCRLSGEVSLDSSFAVQERILGHYGAEVEVFSGVLPAGAPDVILDGLFGTGLSRPLQGEAAACVQEVNRRRDACGSYVIAVDIPSGISSEDGCVCGCAVRCDETRTFAFYKRGHFLHPGAAFCGRLHLAQIGITERAFGEAPGMFTFLEEGAQDLLVPRDPCGNKGTFGKVLVVAGRRNMCGAALLAARAALACGAGMVKIFTHEANRAIVQQALPEALLDTWSEEDPPEAALQRLQLSLKWADVAAAGPAMGTDRMARDLLKKVVGFFAGSRQSLRGLVLDADALRILAEDPALCRLLADRPAGLPCILTPHLAEFASLAGFSVRALAAGFGRRIGPVTGQADRLQSVVACKDARTLVAAPSAAGAGARLPLYLNTSGNSGMATAGSGDVLTGMAAALLALFTGRGAAESAAAAPAWRKLLSREFLSMERIPGGTGLDPGFAAACCAVYLHGRAGDEAARRHSQAGMSAGDIVESLRSPEFWG